MSLIGRAYSAVSEGGRRDLTGITAQAARFLAIGISLYHLYVFTVGMGSYDIMTHRALHLTLILSLAYLLYSPRKQAGRRLSVLDGISIFLPIAVLVYVLLNLQRITLRIATVSVVTPADIIFGILLLLLVLEAARRVDGLPLVIVTMVFLLYLGFGSNLQGMWWHPPFSFTKIIDSLFLSPDGIFGDLIGISSTLVILFVIFGQLLVELGGGDFFINIANALTGRSRGGPAKVAVIASALFGTVSGSAAANVATTGCFTIPMMKKIGFKAHYAGAVELASSTGGAITPPVMSAVAFLMAEIADIPYAQICIAALIPAALWYFAIFLQVHLESVKHKIGGLSGQHIQPAWKVLREGWQFMLPLLVIIAALFLGYSPLRSAIYGIGAAIAAALVRKETRNNIGSRLLKGLEGGTKTAVVVVISLAAGQIMVSAIMPTGIGGKFSYIVMSLAGGQLFPTLFLAMIGCLILGAPLSLSATYILTAVMIVPAAISLGVSPIAAHMFAVYFSVLGNITPPAGSAMFVAGGLAKANPMLVGFMGTRLAIAGFVVPFMFVYNPALLMMGTPLQVILGIVVAATALFAIAAAFEGWLLVRASWIERGLLLTGALTLVKPEPLMLGIGYSLIILIVLVQLWKRRSLSRVMTTVST